MCLRPGFRCVRRRRTADGTKEIARDSGVKRQTSTTLASHDSYTALIAWNRRCPQRTSRHTLEDKRRFVPCFCASAFAGNAPATSSPVPIRNTCEKSAMLHKSLRGHGLDLRVHVCAHDTQVSLPIRQSGLLLCIGGSLLSRLRVRAVR